MEWILSGWAFWASVMPCQDDWLNDLSLMPPMSVTIHALNLAAVVLLFGAGLAHPAASSATTLSAAAALSVPLTVPPLRWRPAAAESPACGSGPAGQGTRDPPESPPG